MNTNARKREPLLTAEYFDKSIAYELGDAIPKFEKKLSGDVPDKKQRARLRYALFKKKLHLIFSCYSRGDAVDTLPALLPPAIDALAAYQAEEMHEPFDIESIDDYQTALWLVSLAILFKLPSSKNEQLIRLINCNGKDALLDTLITCVTSSDLQTAQLKHPKLVQHLFAATQSAQPDRAEHVRRFLQSWYRDRSDAYWHDNHKGPDGGGFFGYWAVEAAGVVAAFAIDDSSFRTMPYYPADLVSRAA